jgi:hypothetical protein
MNELTLKLILLIIPGIIASLVYNRLAAHKKWSNFEYSIHILLLGVMSYLALQLSWNLIVLLRCNKTYNFESLEIWKTLADTKIIPYKEITLASLFAFVLGYFSSFLDKYKIINNIGRRFKVSNKYGDENLFSFFLNSNDIKYVYVRQIKNNLTYHGYVESYSENESISEIALVDVKVYSYLDSDLLYEVDRIYISLNKSEIIIEQANNLTL